MSLCHTPKKYNHRDGHNEVMDMRPFDQAEFFNEGLSDLDVKGCQVVITVGIIYCFIALDVFSIKRD